MHEALKETLQNEWKAVDEYIQQKLVPSDSALEAVLPANAAAGLPAIDVAPNQGKLLHLLALVCRSRRILEVGTLGGYSTIWLARALPADGRLISLELDPRHAETARANVARAGLSKLVEIQTGPAADSLDRLHAEGAPPFDMIFIDADKDNYSAYLLGALRLARKGTLIVADNVVRDGEVVDPESKDPRIQGVRAFFDALSAEPRLAATALQTVGSKGYDGFAMAVVVSD